MNARSACELAIEHLFAAPEDARLAVLAERTPHVLEAIGAAPQKERATVLGQFKDDAIEVCGESARAVIAAAELEAEGFAALEPIDSVRALPALPVEALPGWVAAFVGGVAEAIQTPEDLGGVLALGALSACVGGRVRVRVRDGFEEPTNIFAIVALPPGDRKSPVHNAIVGPLVAWEREETERLRDDVARSASARRALERRRERAERDAANLDPSTPEGADAQDRAQRVAVELDRFQDVRARRVWADDATPERLVGLLAENGGRIALLSAEAGGLAGLVSGRYAEGAPSLDVVLKGHSGDPLRVDRQGRPPEVIDSPALTIAVALQPEALAELVGSKYLRLRGLPARFAFSLPTSRMGCRAQNARPVSPSVRAEYHRGLRALLEAHRGDEVRVLTLDAEALACWQAFDREVEPQLADGGDLEPIRDWAGKGCGLVVRLAGLLHVADHACGERIPEAIPVRTMTRAITLGRYFLEHARAALGLGDADPTRAAAFKLLRRIEREGLTEVSERDAYRWLRGAVRSPQDVGPVCTLLEEHGYLRRLQGGPKGAGRRPTNRWGVRPRPWTIGTNGHNQLAGAGSVQVSIVSKQRGPLDLGPSPQGCAP